MTVKTADQLVAEAKAELENLSPQEAQARIAVGNVTILDVREAQEVAGGHLPNAVCIPRGLLEFRADPGKKSHAPELDPERPIIAYCAGGGRSALAGQALKKLGYKHVANLDGGFKAWQAAGLPVDHD